ncbi:MAG: EF-hand domain-containing protein [Pseudomonadota bacterium]
MSGSVLARRRPVVGTALVLALAGCGLSSGNPGEAFGDFDRNGDGVIEQAEFDAAFAVFDRNGNGRIEVTESPDIVYEADAGRGDGVSQREFQNVAISRLVADANRDGRVTRAEMEAYDRQVILALGRTSTALNPASPEWAPSTRWVHFRF